MARSTAMSQPPTESQPHVLIDHWPRFSRWFFVLCGVVLALIGAGAASQGGLVPGFVMLLISLVLVSFYWLVNRTLLEGEREEVVLRFKWLFWLSERRYPVASVAHVYLRLLGKGGREVGLKLTDGSEVALCQPMGSASDQQEFANQIAGRIGVAVVQVPRFDGPYTNLQLVLMNVILHAFGAVWGFVAWVAATQPATDGSMAWGAVWFCAGVAALVVTTSWYRTIQELRRRRKR